LLTYNPAFASDLRRDSARRSIVDRQFGRIEISEETFLFQCINTPGNSNDKAGDYECLFTLGNFDECINTEGADLGLRASCFEKTCPNASPAVITCVLNTPPNLVDPAIGDNGVEGAVSVAFATTVVTVFNRRSFETQAVSVTDRR
jgi:hypothetical protein